MLGSEEIYRNDLQHDRLNRRYGHPVSGTGQGKRAPPLSLAAAPTLATMALVTVALGSRLADMLRSAMHHDRGS
jgi:hypothetical protein